MSRTAHIVWTSIGVGLMAAMLIAAVVWGYKMTPTAVPCPSLTYEITDKSERNYVTEKELDQLLKSEDVYPVGRSMDIVSLHQIETTVRRHPMVRTAECYMTPRAQVFIRLTQREPLVRVQTPIETYLIDTDRRVMQARNCVKDSVLLVTGNVGPQMASSQLADFAEWLQDNRYWASRVHHVYVQSPQMVILYLRGAGQPRIMMGPLRAYDKKLQKLRTFLEHSAEATKDKHYYELDVRFKGQVIGRTIQ